MKHSNFLARVRAAYDAGELGQRVASRIRPYTGGARYLISNKAAGMKLTVPARVVPSPAELPAVASF